MAEVQSFSTPSGEEVRVEVENAGGGSPSLAEAMRVVSAIGSAVVEEIRAMPQGDAPEEIEMTFGLMGTGEGRLAVTRGLGAANFRLTLRWSGSGMTGSGGPGGAPPEDF